MEFILDRVAGRRRLDLGVIAVRDAKLLDDRGQAHDLAFLRELREHIDRIGQLLVEVRLHLVGRLGLFRLQEPARDDTVGHVKLASLHVRVGHVRRVGRVGEFAIGADQTVVVRPNAPRGRDGSGQRGHAVEPAKAERVADNLPAGERLEAGNRALVGHVVIVDAVGHLHGRVAFLDRERVDHGRVVALGEGFPSLASVRFGHETGTAGRVEEEARTGDRAGALLVGGAEFADAGEGGITHGRHVGLLGGVLDRGCLDGRSLFGVRQRRGSRASLQFVLAHSRDLLLVLNSTV